MRFVWAVLLGACGGNLPAQPDADPEANPLEGIGEVALVEDGFQFVEGPQWVDGALLFSDIPANRIYRLDPPSTITTFREPSFNANGNGLTANGALITAEHGMRRVSRTVDGVVSTLVDRYLGMRLNSPNDLVARSDGTIYFTDPPYGVADADRELDFMGTFRVPPTAGPVAEVMGDLSARPNGIGLSPDESRLYVADTDADLVREYVVAADGSLSGERVLANDTPGADGLAVDAAGNLFVTTSLGIRVLAPSGTLWGTIELDEQPANCAFGGEDLRTLYITARTGLYQVRLANPGLP